MKVYHYTEATQLHRLQHGDLVILADGEVKTVTKCLVAVFFGHCPAELAQEARKAWAMVQGERIHFAGVSQMELAEQLVEV